MRPLCTSLALVLGLLAARAKAQDDAPADELPCVLGAHEGFAVADVRPAAALVCDELRANAIAVGAFQEGTQAVARVEVGFYRVGASTAVAVTQVGSDGETQRRETTRIARLDDVHVAAGCLASALRGAPPTAECSTSAPRSTATSDSMARRSGDAHPKGEREANGAKTGWYLGAGFVAGTGIVSGRAALGGEILVQYQTQHLAFGLTGRVMALEMWVAAAGATVRYMFSDGWLSPFAGLTVGLLHQARGGDGKFGFGLSPEIGLELARTSEFRLGLTGRADLAFYQVGGTYDVPFVGAIYALF